jgi:hypothetical protein
MTLSAAGAERIDAALSQAELATLEALADRWPAGAAGTRIRDDALLDALLATDGAIHRLAEFQLGRAARAVRCVLFDKNAGTNWSLGWHQDRTIAVRQRHDVDGFGPWTRKADITHVEPPFSVIAGMMTIRVHLDPCGPDNGPLRVAPGSHVLGRIPVDKIADVVRRCGELTCLAEPGDVWICATAIVHASGLPDHGAPPPSHGRLCRHRASRTPAMGERLKAAAQAP